MLTKLLKGVFRKARRDPPSAGLYFLEHVSGVLHVGANVGQERGTYDEYGLDVLWIEPIPEVFTELERNIEPYPRQRAIEALVTDRDGAEYAFHVANNDGRSSSILDLAEHRDIWPDVQFERSITLRSTTLATLIREHAVDVSRYDALIMDTQGSELLVLRGAGEFLPAFRFIRTEAADFEAYAGCCRLDEITEFLMQRGFKPVLRVSIARRPAGGKYYDVVYARES